MCCKFPYHPPKIAKQACKPGANLGLVLKVMWFWWLHHMAFSHGQQPKCGCILQWAPLLAALLQLGNFQIMITPPMLLPGRNLNRSSSATMLTFWHQWHTQCPQKLWKQWCLTTWGWPHEREHPASEQKSPSYVFIHVCPSINVDAFFHTHSHTTLNSLDGSMLLALWCFMPWPLWCFWEHSSAAIKPTCSMPSSLSRSSWDISCTRKKWNMLSVFEKKQRRKLPQAIYLSGQKLLKMLPKGLT